MRNDLHRREDDFPQRRCTLTESEVEELRELLEETRRIKWLRGSIRVWAVWAAAVIGGATLFWDSAVRIIKAMVEK